MCSMKWASRRQRATRAAACTAARIFPGKDPGSATRLLSGGLDQVWVAADVTPAGGKIDQLEAAS
jgi:hypothetical protein